MRPVGIPIIDTAAPSDTEPEQAVGAAVVWPDGQVTVWLDTRRVPVTYATMAALRKQLDNTTLRLGYGEA